VKFTAVCASLASPCLVAWLVLSSCMSAQSATAATGSADGGAEVVEVIGVHGLIDIDADGSVDQVALIDSPLRHDIGERLVETLEKWHFKPIDLEGVQRSVRTSFLLRLELMNDTRGYWLRIAQHQFGTPTALSPRSPSYPLSANRDGIEAEILMLVGIKADGSVEGVEPVRGQIFGKRIRSEDVPSRNALKPFIQSAHYRCDRSKVAVWLFHFRLSDGGLAPTLLVPVRFSLTSEVFNWESGASGDMPLPSCLMPQPGMSTCRWLISCRQRIA
jgi:hypothetical protein